MRAKSILRLTLICSVLISVTFTSCIQDEAANSEADILECVVPDMPEEIIAGAKTVKPSPGSRTVKIWVMPGTTIAEYSPEFVLTPGATISPESGTKRDFSTPQTYIVTSEDRKWQKTYSVQVEHCYVMTFVNNRRKFSFEHTRKAEGNYNFDVFFEWDEIRGAQDFWDSGNSGFALTNSNAPADKYPTFSYQEGKEGKGVKLVTRSTGFFGGMVGMPIAAGNLFIGSFDLKSATAKPLEATQFGIRSMAGIPDSLNIWFKYKHGPEYKDKEGNVLDKIDKPSIYAVFYEPVLDEEGSPILLNGTNVQTAPNIISLAKLGENDIVYSEDIDAAEYTFVSIPFINRELAIDPFKLQSGIYHIAIVFSASEQGAFFEGAIGSTLCVDEIELVCKK